MWGGPEPLRDVRPEAGGARGNSGPFRAIPTTVPGIQICELFPKIAGRAHRYAPVRSLHHALPNHNDGSIEVLTGKVPARPDPTSTNFSEHPDFGMVAAELRGRRTGATRICRCLPCPVHGPPQLSLVGRGSQCGESHPGESRRRNCPRNAALTAERLAARHVSHPSSTPSAAGRPRDHDARAGDDDLLTGPDVALRLRPSERRPATPRSVRPPPLGAIVPVGPAVGRGGNRQLPVVLRSPRKSATAISWDDHINPATKWIGDATRHQAAVHGSDFDARRRPPRPRAGPAA